MKRRVGFFALVLSLLLFSLPLQALTALAATPPPCTTPTSTTQGNICILEVQTQGVAANEDEDFVIIANLTAQNLTSTLIQLQYFNDVGVLDSSLSLGTFSAGQIKVYASTSVRTLNSTANKLETSAAVPIALASKGGTLQLSRTSGSVTTVYDKVGWGSAALSETAAAPLPGPITTLARKQVNNVVQDSDNNSNDFAAVPLVCQGAAFNEIQPFVTDEVGESIDAWVELLGTATISGDCALLTGTGDAYIIPGTNMPTLNELTTISGALDSQNKPIPLHIGGSSGQVWLAGVSQYGNAANIKIPFATQSYSNLVKGQTWALIDGAWRRTYTPTPNEPNIYTATAPVVDDDPTACSTVRINELLPNPTGDDTDHEWLELYNDSDTPAALGRCEVDVAGTTYNFLADDTLGSHEWRSVSSLYSSDGSSKALSLRNTDETLVALLRTNGDAPADTIQSFTYADAPEGQSWARFDDGWRWTYTPTPGAANILQATPPVPSVTEFPAKDSPPTTGTGNPGGSQNPASSPPLSITELLPNPAPPQTDENDEFIELYNPNPEPVDLDGYKVQTGTNYSYSFTLDKQSIPANGYLVLTSGATGLTLSNSAGRARLLDPAGNVLSETDAYENAGEGAAWAFIDGTWQWTSSPTSDAANVLTAAATTANKTSSTQKTAAKTTTTKTAKASTATVKAAKTTKPKATTTASTNSGTSGTGGTGGGAPLHAAVIAGVGGLAVLYGAYEYRQDVANTFYKLRRNRANRRANRSGS